MHRISEFKNFSDDTAPGELDVVCCEITCREGDETWQMDLEQGTKVAIEDLETLGLIEPGSARGIDMHKLRYAYPIYDLTYKENLETLKRPPSASATSTRRVARDCTATTTWTTRSPWGAGSRKRSSRAPTSGRTRWRPPGVLRVTDGTGLDASLSEDAWKPVDCGLCGSAERDLKFQDGRSRS